MDRAIGAQRIIRLGLVHSTFEPNLDSSTRRIHRNGCLLMTGYQSLQFLNVAGGESALTFHEIKQTLYSFLLVVDYRGYEIRILVGGTTGNEGSVDALFDQDLGDSTIKRVDAFNDAGLYCPLSL